MRAWPVHVVFATILIGSLAARGRGADMLEDSGSLEPAVLQVARSQGLTFQEYTTISGTDIRALVFAAPSCSKPVLVVLSSVAFQEDPIMRSLRQHDYTRRYVYIDHTWDEPHRVAVVVQRIKYAVLATFGLTNYVPSSHVLLVELPSRCQVAEAIDWRIVWNRKYLTGAGANVTGR